jgi:hypothetical protein
MEQSVDGMKLQTETYSGNFIPLNLPELFQGCEKLEKVSGSSLHPLLLKLGVLTTTLRGHIFLRHLSRTSLLFYKIL